MTHTLLSPVMSFDLDPDDVVVKYSCECGSWQRIFREEFRPPFQEIESDHAEHAHHAGAEELRTGKPPEVTLESLARAMAKFAEATFTAAEAMREFNEAYEAAQERGIGVVIVRNADGSTTSTPNVFIPAGTAVFMDCPGLTLPDPIPTDWSLQCPTNSSESPLETSSPLKAA